MATVVDGDIIKAVACLVTATGEHIQNVFHYRYVGDDIPDFDLNPILLGYIDAMYANIEPAVPSDVSFQYIDITNVTQQVFYGPASWPTLDFGGGTGATMPEQNCALVTGGTARSKTLGKKFLGPFIATNNSDGTWISGLVTALAAFAVDYLADLTVSTLGTLEPVLVHYVNNVMTYVTDIISSSTGNGVYTQRRRRRGVGI